MSAQMGHCIAALGIFLLFLNRVARRWDGPEQQRTTTQIGLFLVLAGETVATMGSW